MRHDLLLTGGHLIDPASGVDGRKDVAFASGRVAAVDTAIPRETAREVVDVSGSYVHVNNPPVEYGEVLTILRPGDIVSHFLHPGGRHALDAPAHGARRPRLVASLATRLM